jgi:hypothetical protein
MPTTYFPKWRPTTEAEVLRFSDRIWVGLTVRFSKDYIDELDRSVKKLTWDGFVNKELDLIEQIRLKHPQSHFSKSFERQYRILQEKNDSNPKETVVRRMWVSLDTWERMNLLGLYTSEKVRAEVETLRTAHIKAIKLTQAGCIYRVRCPDGRMRLLNPLQLEFYKGLCGWREK